MAPHLENGDGTGTKDRSIASQMANDVAVYGGFPIGSDVCCCFGSQRLREVTSYDGTESIDDGWLDFGFVRPDGKSQRVMTSARLIDLLR